MLKKTLLIASLLLLTACANVVYQVKGDEPIKESDTRSLGTLVDDSGLETKVKVAILQSDPRFEDARIRVISYNGKVLLIGQVADSDMLGMATAAANSLSSVKAVHNELTVEENIGVKIRTSDAWLKTKVASRMFTEDGFPSRKIDVYVENGVVYLMGIVDAATEKQAAELANSVEGVQKVVKVFERPKT